MFSLGRKKNQPEDKMDRILKNPKILEVNLIKDEVSLDFNWKRNLTGLGITLIVSALIIFELYAGLDWWQKDEEARLGELKAKIAEQTKEVNDFRKSADEALSYKDKTIEVGNLLNNHVYWTNFFSWLEKNTLSTVSYGGFSGQLDGKYALAGSAGSFADVAWQVKTLLDDPMTLKAEVDAVNASGNKTKEAAAAEAALAEEAAKKEAALNGTEGAAVVKPEAAQPRVNFNISLELKPEIFKK
jgi:hypothetical protein